MSIRELMVENTILIIQLEQVGFKVIDLYKFPDTCSGFIFRLSLENLLDREEHASIYYAEVETDYEGYIQCLSLHERDTDFVLMDFNNLPIKMLDFAACHFVLFVHRHWEAQPHHEPEIIDLSFLDLIQE